MDIYYIEYVDGTNTIVGSEDHSCPKASKFVKEVVRVYPNETHFIFHNGSKFIETKMLKFSRLTFNELKTMVVAHPRHDKDNPPQHFIHFENTDLIKYLNRLNEEKK